MADKIEARKYKFKNITKSDTVYVKEFRKSISPGKEVEWEGVLLPNTKRLVEGKFIEIKDIGPSEKPVKLDVEARRKSLAEKEQKLTTTVREILSSNPNKKSEGKGTVEAVKASDMEEPKPAIIPDPPKEEEEPEKKGKKK